jgi:hypothetical protein
VILNETPVDIVLNDLFVILNETPVDIVLNDLFVILNETPVDIVLNDLFSPLLMPVPLVWAFCAKSLHSIWRFPLLPGEYYSQILSIAQKFHVENLHSKAKQTGICEQCEFFDNLKNFVGCVSRVFACQFNVRMNK